MPFYLHGSAIIAACYIRRMPNKGYIFQGNADNFDTLVIANSHQGPVLVNYYSPDAGPCRVQTSRLADLANEMQGQFLLVNINVNEERGLVRAAGIRAIPSARIYVGGKAVVSMSGAETMSGFRQHLQPYVQRMTDRDRLRARELHQQGQTEAAYQLLAEAILKDPGNIELPLDLAKLLMLEGKVDQVANLLDSLPKNMQQNPQVNTLRMHALFIHTAEIADTNEHLLRRIGNRNDLEARFALAARAVVEDDPQAAIEWLLQIYQVDPEYENRIADRALTVLFELLGDDHELVSTARQRMQDHSTG